jgi:hypothetical protein
MRNLIHAKVDIKEQSNGLSNAVAPNKGDHVNHGFTSVDQRSATPLSTSDPHIHHIDTTTALECPFCRPGRHKTDSSNSSESLTARSITNISSKAQRNVTEPNDPLAEEPIEGGPKTAKAPPENISSARLLEEIDISPDITSDQRQLLETIITRNSKAFGLDGRLGNYEVKVEIPMKPDAEPVSLPPFPVSPANREVIDKQMDSWIQLGVIEPSKSPWAAPVFIVYRNGKPRMVIDLRKLNEMVIADEFPLPRQDDILQALSGSQWLTTLDALAGFTQLTMSDSSAEKLAFRTHRGLWQFRRMPFGYRNGQVFSSE